MNLPLGVFCAGGILFNGGFLLLFLPGVGPEELRLRRLDRTYRLRTAARWRPAFLPGRAKGLRLPWRVVERAGSADEMAGIGMVEVVSSKSRSYVLVLRWTDPSRPAVCVGRVSRARRSTREQEWRALQAQIADDLGVPALGD